MLNYSAVRQAPTKLIDCPHCYGNGELHSPGRPGDPDDPGVECPVCEGACVIEETSDDEG